MELDGVELVRTLRGRQVPLLFAFLVLSRSRSVGRDELLDAIWPESAPRSQDGALRTLLSRLRSGLGNGILTGRDELVLVLPEPAWIDFEAAGAEVRSAIEALDRDDARGAWALAQVPLNVASRGLLPGVQAPWLEPPRRELAEIRLESLEVIGRAGLKLGGGQISSVERAARTLIGTEPYRESGYILLMGALEAQGNVAEGLRVFDRLRGLLRDELGTSPSPEAMVAHERLLHPGGRGMENRAAAAAAAGGGVPHGLPLPPEIRGQPGSPLVGRRDELNRLQSWLAEPGSERVLILSGDAGIGKSRLLEETARQAHAAGATVLAGRAPEETLVPYQPFLEAIGHYVFNAPLPDLRAVTRHSGAELGRLIPELQRRLPQVFPSTRPEPGNPETDRYRLFEAVAALLGDISASSPVLVVLDDLHWSDRPTQLLLRHLARAPQASGLRILGAYRAAEHGTEGYEAALAGLRHERLVRELEVRGLPESDASELIRLRTLETPSAAFVRALYAGTEGNPFFIEAMVRHLADSGVRSHEAGAGELQRFGLPDGVRGVISRRLERLDDDGLECLKVASVIGRDFDSSLLETVLGFDEERFLRALEVALDAGLVFESPGEHGRYSFAHALVRETLYAAMSSDRRTRVHRRVGLALEQLRDPPLGALAHHFTRAAEPGDAERAIRYALAAGAQAKAMLANEEAAEHYARALEVLERSSPDALERRCELLVELGEARLRSGERPASWAVFREAAALAAGLGDATLMARAAIGASRRFIQPPGVIDEELIALLEQALEMTPADQPMTRVVLITRLCGALYFSPERRHDMRRFSAEATAIAARLGDTLAAALAAAARRRAYWGPGHLERRLADSTQLLRSAREVGDLELTLQGHAWLIVDLLEAGDRTAVEAQVAAFEAGAAELRQPVFQWNAAVWRTMLALLDGRLADADRLAAEALSAGIMPEGVTAPQYYAIQLLGIRREQGRMGELEGAAREMLATNPLRLAWRSGLATLLCDTGRHDEARELLAGMAEEFSAVPPDGDWMITFALLADVAADLQDVEHAERLYEVLEPYRDSNVVIGHGAVCFGSVARYLGRLALTVGERDLALSHLRQAVDSSAAMRAPVHLAHARLDHATALVAGGDWSAAQTLIEQAAETASALDLPLVARRAESLSSMHGGLRGA
ncbi:MAG TPA: AAA family ATPase [Solirubrobacteraceae bacterium]|nr:AAA family ATPase [Solirubrobacteraceae bacterium]